MLFIDSTPDLTDIDYTIYNYVIMNMETVAFMRIRDLADATHTSTTSVLRFCNKFECDGFSEFRFKLQQYIKQNEVNIVKTDESEYIDFFTRVTQDHFTKKIQEAAAFLSEKDFLIFIGMGSSNASAKYGALYFSTISNFSLHIEDMAQHPIKHINNDFSKNICLVVLSVSGETKELVQYIERFSLGNSSILSITNSENSTIAKMSDMNIAYYIGREKIKESDITTQVPAVYFIEKLAKECQKIKNQS